MTMATSKIASSVAAQIFNDRETGLMQSGCKCFCCPYGYHIDLDFVRYCENWQTAASLRIAQGNEEKRRKRARQKQRQSMEFLLGLPEEKEAKKLHRTRDSNYSAQSQRHDQLLNMPDWNDTLSNFEKTLSQSYNHSSNAGSGDPAKGLVRQLVPDNNRTQQTMANETLHNIRHQMAAALERMKQLEEQVKEIPMLHVQMSVLREERKILLRQLAGQRKINAFASRRDAGTSCHIVTRDIGVSHQQVKTRESSTNTWPGSTYCSRSTETVPTPEAKPEAHLVSKGVQCFRLALPGARPVCFSKSVQCISDSPTRCSVTKSTQCRLEIELPERPDRIKATDTKSTQVHVEMRDRSTQKLLDPPLPRIRLYCSKFSQTQQPTESPKPKQPVRHNVACSARPNTSDTSTETRDSLGASRPSVTKKSIGVDVGKDLIKSANVASETRPWEPKKRDSGTSPIRKSCVDVSVGASVAPSTNYCDECKQINKNQKPRLIRQDTWTESLHLIGRESETLDSSDSQITGAIKEESAKGNENDLVAEREEEISTIKVQPANSVENSIEALKKSAADDENASVPLEKSIVRPELSKEILAALKLLGENLSKLSSTSGSSLPNRLKNASNIAQHEWFKVSSTAQADPIAVECFLEKLEQQSLELLKHIVNLKDSSGNTAMHYAVSHGNFDVVSILLNSNCCEVDRPNNAGYTPVMLAALAQLRNSTHASVVKRLFQVADINVRAKLHGQTALMLAVSHGRKDMTRLLLDAGAAVNLQDEDGSTALMCAAEHGHTDIVKLLLSQADCDSSIVDVDGSSALKIALEAGHADLGVLLYSHQRVNRTSPVCTSLTPIARIGKRQRTTSSSGHAAHKQGSLSGTMSMSAPASPVPVGSRKFHSSSISLVDSPKFSL